MLLARTNHSIFTQRNTIEIRLFSYRIQSIVFMQTAEADLSHNKNISRRIARSSVFFQNSLRMFEQSRRRHARNTKFYKLQVIRLHALQWNECLYTKNVFVITENLWRLRLSTKLYLFCTIKCIN